MHNRKCRLSLTCPYASVKVRHGFPFFIPSPLLFQLFFLLPFETFVFFLSFLSSIDNKVCTFQSCSFILFPTTIKGMSCFPQFPSIELHLIEHCFPSFPLRVHHLFPTYVVFWLICRFIVAPKHIKIGLTIEIQSVNQS